MTRVKQSTRRRSRGAAEHNLQHGSATALNLSARQIDFLHTLTLGGVDQAIHVHGSDPTSPVLLFLHGGPGLPHMPFAHVNAELTRSFVVVHWDQRGAGKSYSPALTAADFSIEQFVSDTRELILWLCERFGKAQVVLAGHSWGSALGAMVAARYPQLVAMFVGIGQIANLRLAERERFQFALALAHQRRDLVAAASLVRLGPPPYHSVRQSDSLEHWACHLAGDCWRPLAEPRFFQLALSSPVYSWLDLVRIPLGVRLSERCLWNELVRELDLFRHAPRLEMPVCFLVGGRDVVCTHSLARRYFEALHAPCGKKFITFEHSGHWPHLEEPERFRTVLVERVRRALGPEPIVQRYTAFGSAALSSIACG